MSATATRHNAAHVDGGVLAGRCQRCRCRGGHVALGLGELLDHKPVVVIMVVNARRGVDNRRGGVVARGGRVELGIL